MKKLIAILSGIFFLGMASVAFALPFLNCDPYLATDVQPNKFRVIINGHEVVTDARVLDTGEVDLHLDLGPLAQNGTNTCEVSAIKHTDTEWLESAPVPFGFEFGPGVTVPSGLKLSGS
jgi:hypothetical protein